MRREFTKSLLLALALLLAFGCGSDGDDPAAPAGGRLDDTRLAVDSVGSLGKVYVLNLPSPKAAEDYFVIVSAGGEDQGRLWIESDEGGAYFHAPLHPLTPNEGGTVQIRISDGEVESPRQDLDVSPLPPAPGAFEAIVVALRNHVEQRANWAGTSITELKSQSFAEIDPTLFPIKVAQHYVDSTEPGSLGGLVMNEGAFLTSDERELLERMCGYATFGDLVQAEVDSFLGADPLARAAGGPSASKRACFPGAPPLTTPGALSDAMLASALADVAINTDSAPGRTLDALGTILQGGSVLPVYGKAFSTVGAGVAAWETSADFTRSVLPNRFTHLSFDYDRPEFDEDETRPGKWSNVKVVAASDGWTANPEVADIVAGRLSKVLTPPQRLNVREFRALKKAAMAGFNSELQDYLDENGGFEICAETWEVDITGLPWSTAQVLDRKFSVDTAALEVRPLEVGSDNLRVAAQSSQFGGREIHVDLPIKTQAIQVSVLPDDVYVETLGESILLTGSIEYAQDERLYWDAQAGSWDDGLGIETDGGAVRSLETPTTPGFYPFLVRVESMSRDGLRAGGLPSRHHIVTVHDGSEVQLVIEPRHKCIAPGETLQFTATVTGVEEYTVLWNVIEGYGSIDADGLYQSLSVGTSNAVIEAKLQEDANVNDRARVDVSSCNCMLDVTITGDSNWERQSSQAAFQVFQFGDLFYQFWLNFDGEDFPNITAGVTGSETQTAPQPGETGSWKASFAYFTGAESWVSVWDDPKVPLPGVSLNITEFTEQTMAGSFTGNAFQLNGEGEISSVVGVDVQFRAGYWDGGGWPCE